MKFEDLTYNILGACFEVYRRMGSGFLEAVYQECLEIEFTNREVPFIPQQELKLKYKDRVLNKSYIPDFVCFDKIIIEIKAIQELTNAHYAQLLNYLYATGMQLGFLVNFGAHPKLEYKRMVI